MSVYRALDLLTSPVTRPFISFSDPKPGIAKYIVLVVKPGATPTLFVLGQYKSQRIAARKVDEQAATLKRAFVVFFDKTGQPWWIDQTGVDLPPP